MAVKSDLKRRVEQRARAAHRAALTETARLVRDGAREDTGAMKRSIRTPTQRRSGNVYTGVIEIPVSGIPSQRRKALWQEKGTRPHVIRPRTRKVLRFRTGGEVVFAQKVNHPGTEAKPFFYPVLNGWSQRVRDAYRKAS